MKWDWQVFSITALHSVTRHSTVSELLIHLMPDNFHMLKTEQREENQGPNQSPNSQGCFYKIGLSLSFKIKYCI